MTAWLCSATCSSWHTYHVCHAVPEPRPAGFRAAGFKQLCKKSTMCTAQLDSCSARRETGCIQRGRRRRAALRMCAASGSHTGHPAEQDEAQTATEPSQRQAVLSASKRVSRSVEEAERPLGASRYHSGYRLSLHLRVMHSFPSLLRPGSYLPISSVNKSITKLPLLQNMAVIHACTLRLNECFAVAEYMALPASQYSVLDAKKIDRIDERTFRCYVDGIQFFGLTIEPILTVSVTVGERGPTVKLLKTRVCPSAMLAECCNKL